MSKRKNVPVNMTVPADLLAAARDYCGRRYTTLSQLFREMLIERLASEYRPPSKDLLAHAARIRAKSVARIRAKALARIAANKHV